ncbi:hypothetical protein [Halorhodospira halophila]|uniref:hypothetical protein n=1 Tax=Halorhodospira halophila TaxID=1053 RepID=UPI001913C438|nr:hypothetical protein [Halorhodospira halophila]MBK5942754.1 hypothetical protein [Halorhodospira halophila]
MAKKTTVEIIEEAAGRSLQEVVFAAADEGLTCSELAAGYGVKVGPLRSAINWRGLSGLLANPYAPRLDAEDAELIQQLWAEHQRHKAEATRLKREAREMLARADDEEEKARSINATAIADKMGCGLNMVYRVINGDQGSVGDSEAAA